MKKLVLSLIPILSMTAFAQSSGPTYLEDVNLNPQPGPYKQEIDQLQSVGLPPIPILYLYAYRNNIGVLIGKAAQEIIRGDAPISPGMRELLGAYVSGLNKVDFCTKIHGAAAAQLLGNEGLVNQVVRNPETSDLSEKDKALFRFAKKMTLNIGSMSQKDVQILTKLGWSEEAVYYLISTTSIYGFFNHWAMAAGVRPLSDEVMKAFGAVLVEHGYAP
jgi:uncharacterized peroxidase-related enzyme